MKKMKTQSDFFLSFALIYHEKKKMSCKGASIDSNVIPAVDEFYRWDQTHVPVDYMNQCDSDPAGLPPTCHPTKCDSGMEHMEHMEHMNGAYQRRRSTWYPRMQPIRRSYSPYPRTWTVQKRYDSSWWLPVGVAVALLFVFLKK
jgi:hypothetical protein